MKYFCPCCQSMKPETHFSCKAGAKGGKAKGPQKARSSEQARKAINARWEREREKKNKKL